MKGGLYSFWFVNHLLEKDELVWQLNEMHDKGFRGVFMHPRDGLNTPWGSESWFDNVNTVRIHCKKLGMELWIYDEDPYPSGAAGGKLFLDHSEYIARHLEITTMSVKGGNISVDFPSGRLIKVFALPKKSTNEENWIDLTAHTGIVRTNWNEPWYRSDGYYVPYDKEGTAHWRASTNGIHFRTVAALPEGEWEICAFIEQHSTWGRWGYYTDILNPKAVEYFIQLAYEPYKRFSDDFGKTIPGLFTDEPSLTGTHAWSPAFEEFFQANYGYSICEKLPHLFFDIDKTTPTIRYQYRHALGAAYNKSFIRQVTDWCTNNKLLSTGHMSPEENPIGQTMVVPYLLSQLKCMDLPGTDLINGHIGSSTMPLLHLGPKFPSSAASHTGKNRALVEAYGANSWDTSLETLIKMTNWLIALGVTDVVSHGQYYSIDGLRKKEAPPSYFYQSAAWRDFSSFSEYLNDLSLLMSEGRRDCSLLLYYPQGLFSALIPDNISLAEKWREKLGEIIHSLLSEQWDFDIVDEETLLEYEIAGSVIKNKHHEYSALVIPCGNILENSVISFAISAIKSKFPVFFTDSVCTVLKSDDHDISIESANNLFAPKSIDDIISKLKNIIPRKLEINGTGYLQKRLLDNNTRYMFVNADNECQNVSINQLSTNRSFSVTLPPQQSVVFDCTNSNLELLLLSGRKSEYIFDFLNTDNTKYTKSHIDTMLITPDDDNVLLLANWTKITDNQSHLLDISLKPDFTTDKVVTYITSFNSTSNFSQNLFLVSELSSWEGDVELSLNGKHLSDLEPTRRFDCCNFQLNISKFVTNGKNELKLSFPNGGCLKEPLRIYGPFIVPQSNTISLSEKSYSVNVGENWSDLGFPYYGGTMSYSTKLSLEYLVSKKSYWLYASQIKDSAYAVINGTTIHTLVCQPFAWNISPYLKSGENQVEIWVTNNSAGLIENRVTSSGILGNIEIVEIL